MTTLLTTHDVARIVATHGLPTMLGRMVEYIEADFGRWNDFDKTARTAAHSEVGVIELMPVADDKEYSFKYVNGHPGNYQHGLSTVMAFGALADVDTGMPTVLSELTLTTAIRTAATSVMAAKRLARKNSKVMALIGNGAQSEFQALAFHHLLGIEEVRLFDVDPGAIDKLAANLASAAPGLRVVRCSSTAEAVRGADIVTTVTADKKNATILSAAMIEPGMHVNAVGGDCPGKTELDPQILLRDDARTYVEFEPQSRIEGELQHMTEDFRVTEFWRVVGGEAEGRTSDADVTIFDSVGFALEDYASLRLMRDCAVELELGRKIDLVPVMEDPKDLFGHLVGTALAQEAKAA
ncbi:ornithine cyclodeaminase [Lysobacter sp. A289]